MINHNQAIYGVIILSYVHYLCSRLKLAAIVLLYNNNKHHVNEHPASAAMHVALVNSTEAKTSGFLCAVDRSCTDGRKGHRQKSRCTSARAHARGKIYISRTMPSPGRSRRRRCRRQIIRPLLSSCERSSRRRPPIHACIDTLSVQGGSNG